MRRALVLLVTIFLSFTTAFAKDKYQRPGPIHLDRGAEKWAEKTLRKMSVEEKVGQLFMIWVRARFYDLQDPTLVQLEDTIRQDHIGGLAMTVPVDGDLLIKTGPYEAAMVLNQLQRDSKIPLLIAADFERGVSMRLDGSTVFPHAMAFGAAGKLDYAESFGRITAQEARAIGVQWNFFPDADVNSNPANPIINTRSFGEDPQQVGDLVAAYIRGAKQGGMMTTAKHFPGHGDTATDSHLGVARVSGDLGRLRSVELPPFRKAIEAGVDSVMVAHVSVPALEADPNKVSTTSTSVVTDLLKNQLGFKGIVTTDALDMAGLTRLYANNVGQAAVAAFQAGNDLLLIPADLDASYKAMLAAVNSGEIPHERLDASVLKLLKAKAALNLQKAKLVDIEAIPKLVAQPASVATAQQIADDAITLVRDNGRLLPLKRAGTVSSGLPYQRVEEVHNRLVAVILSDDVRADWGRTMARELRARVPDANIIFVDPRTAAASTDQIMKVVAQAQAVIAAVFVIPTAGKVIQGPNGVTNSVTLADASGTLLESILNRAGEKTAVLAMGNPYLATDFPTVQNYLCTFSSAAISEMSAIKALFGEIAIHGRLPVTVPNIAQRGAGIERPAYGGSQNAQASGH
jgi:beta-N-acetylhexosaminidase